MMRIVHTLSEHPKPSFAPVPRVCRCARSWVRQRTQIRDVAVPAAGAFARVSRSPCFPGKVAAPQRCRIIHTGGSYKTQTDFCIREKAATEFLIVC